MNKHTCAHPCHVHPQTVKYENRPLAVIRAVLYLGALLYMLIAVLWWRGYMEFSEPYGTVYVATEPYYDGTYDVSVSSGSYSYCGDTYDCVNLDPAQAVFSDSKGEFATVTTRVSYVTESCSSCQEVSSYLTVPPASGVSTSVYSTVASSTYYVTGVEDMELYIQHGGMVPWGFKNDEDFYFGTSRTMDGREGLWLRWPGSVWIGLLSSCCVCVCGVLDARGVGNAQHAHRCAARRRRQRAA